MYQNVLNPASFWLFDAGEQWLYGCWFYRPGETFHLATRKFLEKEVFRSDYYNKVPVSKILGKCMVLFVKVNRTKLSGPSSPLPSACPCPCYIHSSITCGNSLLVIPSSFHSNFLCVLDFFSFMWPPTKLLKLVLQHYQGAKPNTYAWIGQKKSKYYYALLWYIDSITREKI